jgi:hypothetical protein
MYRTVAQLDAALETLVTTRPDFCSRMRLGDSIEGRTIYALRVCGLGAEQTVAAF